MMTQPRQPDHETIAEGIEVILEDLGVTIEELDARRGRFRNDDERRAWYVVSAARQDGLVSR